MSRIRRIELIEPYSYYPTAYLRETSIFAPKTLSFPSFFEEFDAYELGLGLELASPCPSAFELFDSVTDLIRVERTPLLRRIHRLERLSGDFFLERLSDRVSELESRFDRLARIRSRGVSGDRKYTWTAEIKSPKDAKHCVVDRTYKLTAEIKDGKKEITGKTYKWTAEIEGKGSDGPIARKYTFKASSGDAGDFSEAKKKEHHIKKKKCDKGERATRVVLIEEPSSDHGAVVLRQAFAKRIGRNEKGKKKELSLQDAAMMIQMSFRAYLIRRSKALRALRDLAVAKTKLKEIRASFNNFSYRRFVSHDAEERQKFSEKIIVLLLTVDAIEGVDLMVRTAKRSMVDELEAMLDVVDPQPSKRSLSMRRRTFDMPDSVIQKEIAAGVAEVVQMLNHEENIANTFEASL